jgi:transcriptional regulator with XRE-family HTH domain
MPLDSGKHPAPLRGHALRNARLRARSLARAESAPALSRTLVKIRADVLGMTRLQFARQSGIARGTLRDLELGIHAPTRRTLRRFVDFCQKKQVECELVEQLRLLYAGEVDSLGRFIARLELMAGSPRALARRVGISPATLWEYRRGNFPMPLALLRKMCAAVAADPTSAERLWHEAERNRLLLRGYPPPLAEFWSLCARAGLAEKHVIRLGIRTPAARQMRYLELPPWKEVSEAARALCRDEAEWAALGELWATGELQGRQQARDTFGSRLGQLRVGQGMARRALANLFKIGGKKPARIIKYIEEDGFYSAQAYPAGLVALLSQDPTESARLLECWRQRRSRFHRRHRPETLIDLRLTREAYGFELRDMRLILGYDSLEYQRIERGLTPMRETASARIQEAIVQAGEQKVERLLEARSQGVQKRLAWQRPESVRALISLLLEREGGLLGLVRHLRRAGVNGFWAGRLRALARGEEVPAWHVLARLGQACGVTDLAQVQLDWGDRFRDQLRAKGVGPLGSELRLLIALHAANLREFSPMLGFNYSVLVRDMQRIDRDQPGRWFHIERILRACGLTPDEESWKEVRTLWYTADVRRSLNQRRQRRATATTSG